MECNFNFYDISTYILPGLIALFFAFWLIFDIFGYNLFPKIGSISCAILILLISYGIGYLILPIGSWIDHHFINKSNEHYSYSVMNSGNSRYSLEFKTHIKELSENLFKMKWDEPNQEDKSRYNDLFYLCYYYATNKAQNGYIDTFNGIFGLYRNFMSIGTIGILISTFILIKNFIIYYYPSIPHFYWSYGSISAGIGLVFSFIILYLSRVQLLRFNEHFINAIYRNFYVLATINKK